MYILSQNKMERPFEAKAENVFLKALARVFLTNNKPMHLQVWEVRGKVRGRFRECTMSIT